MAVVNVTKSSFENEVLKADQTVLVDFWADWCMPCKMLAHQHYLCRACQAPLYWEIGQNITGFPRVGSKSLI